MYKIKKAIKIIMIFLAIIGMSFFSFKNAMAVSNLNNLNTVNIQSNGDCGQLLKYQGIIVQTFYATYTYDGKTYPAYCLDKTKHRCF